MASWAADPKPVRRHKATPAEWEQLRDTFKHACCCSCGIAYQHLHHIAFRKADSGDDVAENLAPMCDSCHDRFHGRRDNWELVAAHIRSFVMSQEARLRYAERKLGDRFNKRYPPLPNTDPQFEDDFRRIYSVHQTPKDAA